ncbi:MAG: peptidoglycan DD-metalloendopeptidase family protein [Litoreibacter sp.]
MRLLALLLCLATPSFGQSDPITIARRAGQMLDVASTKLSEAERASDRVAALTSTVRAYEEGLSAIREGIRRAAIRERSIKASFDAKRDRLSRLLGILQTIQKTPKPLLLLHPSGPLGTARAGMVISDVTPALQSEAETLRTELTEMAQMRSLQTDAAAQLQIALSDVQAARSALSQAMADRVDLPTAYLADSTRIDQILSVRGTVQEFADALAALDVERTSNPADFESARGKLTLPVSGTLLTGFQQPGTDGIRRPGLRYAVRGLNLVTTPWPATVRFAGPFLDQGHVVILEPGKGYLIVLAGMGQTYAKEGEILEKGAPIGIMGGLPQNADAFLIDAVNGNGANQEESLYIELRQGETPVDPTSWFALNRE